MITFADAEALLETWVWQQRPVEYEVGYVLKAEECILEIYPRPGYCDRGRWEMHVVCPGFPQNPNPIDAADMFPRVYFMLRAAQLEGVVWMDVRHYTPLVEEADNG